MARSRADGPDPEALRRGAIVAGILFALLPILLFDCFRLGGACFGIGVWPGVVLAVRALADREGFGPKEGAKLGFVIGGAAAGLRVLAAFAFGFSRFEALPLDETVAQARELLEHLGYFEGLSEADRHQAMVELVRAQELFIRYGDAATAVLHALGGALAGAVTAAFAARRRATRDATGGAGEP